MGEVIDMWWNILKKPYIIETDEEYGKEWSWKFNRLYQGSQGEEDTGYWTPRLTEALIYAFFGSRMKRKKDVAKPRIKQTIPTKENKFLDYDNEYGTTWRKKDATPRGRLAYFDNEVEYKYLPDSRVKELAEKLLKDLIEKKENVEMEEGFRDSIGVNIHATGEFKDYTVIPHLEGMLNKYF